MRCRHRHRDARDAHRWHVPASHRRRHATGPSGEGWRVRRAHRGVSGFTGQDRSGPAAGPSALLSCAIPTGYGSAANRAGVRGGDTVVVLGAGGIGTGAIQGARINGAAQIVAVDPVEFKQKSAYLFGATHGAGSISEAMALVRELTHGVMADSVLVSPSLITADDVRDALRLTRKGGTCVLAGMTSQLTRSVNIDLQEFILMNKTLAGTIFGSCNPRADIARLAGLYQSGQLQLDEMITRRYRLDDINAAYTDLLNGDIVRGIIDFTI